MNKSELIKNIYLYTFSAVGLILLIVGSVKILDLGLKSFVFKNADVYYMPKISYENNLDLNEEKIQRELEEQNKAQEIARRAEREKTMSNSLALIIVGLPLFLYHWKKIKDN
jgi:hypothetical protein